MSNEMQTDRVADTLKKKFLEWQYINNAKLPQERVLAEDLGVSRITLRRALSRLKDENLVKSIQGNGSYIICDNLPRKILIICDKPHEPWSAMTIVECSRFIVQNNYHFSLLISASPEQEIAKFLKSNKDISGILIISPYLQKNVKSIVRQSALPVVMLGDFRDPGICALPCCQINGSNINSGRIATEILIKRGHTKIALVIQKGKWEDEILTGYKKSLIEHGIKLDKKLIVHDLPPISKVDPEEAKKTYIENIENIKKLKDIATAVIHHNNKEIEIRDLHGDSFDYYSRQNAIVAICPRELLVNNFSGFPTITAVCSNHKSTCQKAIEKLINFQTSGKQFFPELVDNINCMQRHEGVWQELEEF
jgi:DNA-binding LacI/PurR family transcriptional regulator